MYSYAISFRFGVLVCTGRGLGTTPQGVSERKALLYLPTSSGSSKESSSSGIYDYSVCHTRRVKPLEAPLYPEASEIPFGLRVLYFYLFYQPAPGSIPADAIS